MVKVGRPVRRFVLSSGAALSGFLGDNMMSLPKARDHIPVWQSVIEGVFFILMLIGIIGMITSFVSWIVDAVATRRRAGTPPPLIKR
jgi:hypothetical protein